MPVFIEPALCPRIIVIGHKVNITQLVTAFTRDIGLIPPPRPISSPQSNGMAEAFIRTLKRGYVRVNPKPAAQTIIAQIPGKPANYNEVHPYRTLGYRSPCEFIATTRERLVSYFGKNNTLPQSYPPQHLYEIQRSLLYCSLLFRCQRHPNNLTRQPRYCVRRLSNQ